MDSYSISKRKENKFFRS